MTLFKLSSTHQVELIKLIFQITTFIDSHAYLIIRVIASNIFLLFMLTIFYIQASKIISTKLIVMKKNF